MAGAVLFPTCLDPWQAGLRRRGGGEHGEIQIVAQLWSVKARICPAPDDTAAIPPQAILHFCGFGAPCASLTGCT